MSLQYTGRPVVGSIQRFQGPSWLDLALYHPFSALCYRTESPSVRVEATVCGQNLVMEAAIEPPISLFGDRATEKNLNPSKRGLTRSFNFHRVFSSITMTLPKFAFETPFTSTYTHLTLGESSNNLLATTSKSVSTVAENEHSKQVIMDVSDMWAHPELDHRFSLISLSACRFCPPMRRLNKFTLFILSSTRHRLRRSTSLSTNLGSHPERQVPLQPTKSNS
ncbi:hypothetical protein C8J56DRAFT_323045 [Mycena floridula]|nr:hypothetical protein C8J56DRAFT_323045 [Mycena floridula]